MIDRCYCYEKTFAAILALAKKNNWKLEDIQEHLLCGTKCGLCVPFIKDALKTGRTEYGPSEWPK